MKGNGGTGGVRHQQLDMLAMVLLTVLSASWGLNQVAIKLANEGISPVLQSGLRSAGGAILVFGWCWLRSIRLFDADRTLKAGIVVGALFAAEFVCIYTGLLFTTAARGIVLLYSMPFFVALGAHFLLPGERMSLMKAAGLAAAFVGVVLALADGITLPGNSALIGDALMVLGAALWGATTIVIRLTPLARVRAEKTLLYQLAVSAAVTLPLSFIIGEVGIFNATPMVLGALGFQIVWVVAITYLVWFWIMIHYPAAQMASFTFLAPVFGVAFGGLLLGERVGPLLIGALALVALGIYLVNRPQRAGR
jgi:drug/metabolite transporter (DMT)-like permease